MKYKRYKRIRKFLKLYQLNFKLKPPYKVLMDGEFIQAALEGKIMLKEQIPKLVQDDHSAPFVTKCVLQYLQAGGGFYSGAARIASTLGFLKCRHKKGVLSPKDCILLQVPEGNPDGLILAAQDLELREAIRRMPAVPLFFIRGSVPVMEAPEGTMQESIVGHVQALNRLSQSEQTLVSVGSAEHNQQGEEALKKRKRKGPKQPNPLSMKKKKPKEAQQRRAPQTQTQNKAATQAQPNKKRIESATKQTNPTYQTAQLDNASTPKPALFPQQVPCSAENQADSDSSAKKHKLAERTTQTEPAAASTGRKRKRKRNQKSQRHADSSGI
eukprot:gb/GEZN01011257.1/.p1 GENE.gb/GEZN01011257.1/~~gb/GEZN01011257.1/.p1  ORF type:complete len:327 (-),score=77.77 gb/GEZN01011257.1/:158-1138(-)